MGPAGCDLRLLHPAWLTRAIADQGFHACDADGDVLAAVEMRHLPTAPQRLLSQRRTEKSSATENEECLGLRITGAKMPGRSACHLGVTGTSRNPNARI